MIRTVAIVPVRGRAGGKTRLAPLFDESKRAALVERMAWHVVSTIQHAGVVDLTVIVSRDQEFRFKRSNGASTLEYIVQPEREPGLNAALDFGRTWALEQGADRLLVISADLPLLEPADVHELADRRAPVVIAPDRFATGTNGLMLGGTAHTARSAAARFSFRFGPDSFHDHLAEAERIGVVADTASAPGTGFDLDTPEDWNRLPGHVQHRLLDPGIARPDEERSTIRIPLANCAAWAESV